MLKYNYVDCHCHIFSHSLRFCYDDNTPDDMWISLIYSDNKNFIQRFYLCLCYLINFDELLPRCVKYWIEKKLNLDVQFRCMGPDFETYLIGDEQVIKLRDYLNSYLENYDL